MKKGSLVVSGCLGYIGDYMGIIVNHYKDPYNEKEDCISGGSIGRHDVEHHGILEV